MLELINLGFSYVSIHILRIRPVKERHSFGDMNKIMLNECFDECCTSLFAAVWAGGVILSWCAGELARSACSPIMSVGYAS